MVACNICLSQLIPVVNIYLVCYILSIYAKLLIICSLDIVQVNSTFGCICIIYIGVYNIVAHYNYQL